jgi:hypothetical protein
MKCPKCGYMRQTRDDAFVPATECPSCGIVYAKHDTIAAPKKGPSTTTAPHLRPSAVDPESLKKARERVEKRLRERMDVRERGDRYEQTLELAKKITAESNHSDQDPLLKALEKRLENTPIDPSDNPAVITDDPVLLEEMVGVQIHNGKDGTKTGNREEKKAHEGQSQADADTPVEASEKTTPGAGEVEAQTTNTNTTEIEVAEAISPHTETDPHETDTAEASAPEAEPEPEPAFCGIDDPAYPEDVQVETVLLKSQLENAEEPPMAQEETGQPAAEIRPPDIPDDIPDDRPDDKIDHGDEDTLEECIAAASTATHFGGNLTRLLPIVAWFILITGLVGAVLSWTTIGDVEAGVNAATGAGASSGLPLGLLLGFAYLATGALGFAFFWVSSVINRHLKDIRQILMVHQGASKRVAVAAGSTSE